MPSGLWSVQVDLGPSTCQDATYGFIGIRGTCDLDGHVADQSMVGSLTGSIGSPQDTAGTT